MSEPKKRVRDSGPFHDLSEYPGGLENADLHITGNGYSYWFATDDGVRYRCPLWLKRIIANREAQAQERIRDEARHFLKFLTKKTPVTQFTPEEPDAQGGKS